MEKFKRGTAVAIKSDGNDYAIDPFDNDAVVVMVSFPLYPQAIIWNKIGANRSDEPHIVKAKSYFRIGDMLVRPWGTYYSVLNDDGEATPYIPCEWLTKIEEEDKTENLEPVKRIRDKLLRMCRDNEICLGADQLRKILGMIKKEIV